MKLTFSKKTTIGRYEPEHIRMISNLYWDIVLTLFFLVVALALAYGILGLVRILHSLGEGEHLPTLPSSVLDRAELEKVLEGFKSRETQFEILRSRRSAIISDPR